MGFNLTGGGGGGLDYKPNVDIKVNEDSITKETDGPYEWLKEESNVSTPIEQTSESVTYHYGVPLYSLNITDESAVSAGDSFSLTMNVDISEVRGYSNTLIGLSQVINTTFTVWDTETFLSINGNSTRVSSGWSVYWAKVNSDDVTVSVSVDVNGLRDEEDDPDLSDFNHWITPILYMKQTHSL